MVCPIGWEAGIHGHDLNPMRERKHRLENTWSKVESASPYFDQLSSGRGRLAPQTGLRGALYKISNHSLCRYEHIQFPV